MLTLKLNERFVSLCSGSDRWNSVRMKIIDHVCLARLSCWSSKKHGNILLVSLSVCQHYTSYFARKTYSSSTWGEPSTNYKPAVGQVHDPGVKGTWTQHHKRRCHAFRGFTLRRTALRVDILGRYATHGGDKTFCQTSWHFDVFWC